MKDFISIWKCIHQNLKKKNKKQVSCEVDGVIMTLLYLGFSKHEVTAFLNVGGYRISRLMESLKTPYQVKESKPHPVYNVPLSPVYISPHQVTGNLVLSAATV